jgi:radical SAM superfamily enzyme YgiQ (UPF0313 family)
MKILLVYPEFPDTFWSFKHALKFIRKKASAPPLGLLTVAAMLPSNWEKRLADLNVSHLSDADLAWADAVFLSAMVVQRESAREIIQRCKTAGVKVIAGGPLFTMESNQFPEVDHFVLNEAEETLKPFLRDLEEGRAGPDACTRLTSSRISTRPLSHSGTWRTSNITAQSVSNSRVVVRSTVTFAT